MCYAANMTIIWSILLLNVKTCILSFNWITSIQNPEWIQINNGHVFVGRWLILIILWVVLGCWAFFAREISCKINGKSGISSATCCGDLVTKGHYHRLSIAVETHQQCQQLMLCYVVFSFVRSTYNKNKNSFLLGNRIFCWNVAEIWFTCRKECT